MTAAHAEQPELSAAYFSMVDRFAMQLVDDVQVANPASLALQLTAAAKVTPRFAAHVIAALATMVDPSAPQVELLGRSAARRRWPADGEPS